ncbi:MULTISPECIES: histone deacetylase family protein [Olivibacter]|uniref:Histone deacetylase n=2 Tax=Olivibacter TaxID=376469 RepID=A0ABV6HIY1_9SPHI|nr:MULTISPECIES: histone deacetylase [Olivibacter]MCL4638877.1 histone deacetylase [Olivibacter sp. UJ_SKK_5.1]MDM8174902.1 histone deacetylase [Olivibacter sp. 47]MDX3913419.1 histone deacetylase [Pseudosphingobacterium sp.]QEL01686.1 histone deacetylase [Olivibacter sp. LS-1]
MLKIAFDPLYVHPVPVGHRFPMLKYELIPEQLVYEGTVLPNAFFRPHEVDEHYITLAHQITYWEKLKNLNLSTKEIRRTGFSLSKLLVYREISIVQGTIECCDHALQDGIAFNIAGGTHHAGSNWGEGFCLLNDQAIGAHYLLSQKKAKKILIIDLDVHQGNGTADIFKSEQRVFTFSMHCQRNFPFRKEHSDLDIGLPEGVGDEEYLGILEKNLEALFNQVKPEFVFYLAGVDVLETDKLGWLSLSKPGCKTRDEIVFEYCRRFGVPVQVSMGGGYSTHIKDIVDAHCNTFKAAIDKLY